MSKNFILVFCALLLNFLGVAQYSPAAGQPGTTAVHKDSAAIISWANSIIQFQRGAADISNGWGVLASFGDSTEAIGSAEGNSTNVVSLGDSGSITLEFPFPIMNGLGNDFAIFENSFSDDYLEFAFVEVSSDGFRFVRFPAVSLIQSIIQTGPYENSNTELVHNLAGKYRQGYGTPFDLEDLVDSSGINLDSILYVRVLDVIGTVELTHANYDDLGNVINDPYPSDFASGGFDLDGVGVIHENNIYASSLNQIREPVFSVFPNPSSGDFFINSDEIFFDCRMFDLSGKLIWSKSNCSSGWVYLADLVDSGIYFLELRSEDKSTLIKILI